jgi:hypothetical protein
LEKLILDFNGNHPKKPKAKGFDKPFHGRIDFKIMDFLQRFLAMKKNELT